MTDQQGTDTVEREATLPAGPDEVWEALTDEDRLAEWLRRRPATARSRRSSSDERVAFTWARPGEGRAASSSRSRPSPPAPAWS